MSDALLQLSHGRLAPRSVDKLIGRYGSASAAVRAVLRGEVDLAPSVVEAVRVPADQRREVLASTGIEWLPQSHERFPARLRRHPGAPRWIFVRGDPADLPSIGIVGTRTCTGYGIELATAYGMAAATRGWCVVSGLAKGIDGAAHDGAVSASGSCIAVLGSGIDVVYPRRHQVLYRKIAHGGGAVISEFPPGTRPDAWRFPTRNRIICGLSDAILVVEAGEVGGALITARIALDYGIPVFATPGDVDRPASLGTNRLIRDGAFPVFGADDLEQVLDLVTPFVAG